LIIASENSSRYAAEYGAYLFKHLGMFDTVKSATADRITKGDLERLKYGGYLTLSIDGSSKNLTKGIEMAHEYGLTCVNIVNQEDSAITRVISERGFHSTKFDK
jgi:fructoselysine-6-P-deglycase FrlB-like protein